MKLSIPCQIKISFSLCSYMEAYTYWLIKSFLRPIMPVLSKPIIGIRFSKYMQSNDSGWDISIQEEKALTVGSCSNLNKQHKH